MGVIKEGMATDKEFLSSATETIKKCFVKFSGRLEKLQQKKAKFEERIEEVALQEKHAAAAVKQLDDAVTHAKDEVAKMASLAKDFGSKNLEVTLSGGPTVDTTKNVQKAKEYAKEYFSTVLTKLTSDLETCQDKQVCQIVKLKGAIDGDADTKRKPREAAIVHGSYLKCALKDGGTLAAQTEPKKCSAVGFTCIDGTDGSCRDAIGKCYGVELPTAKSTVGWKFAQGNTKVCPPNTKPCQDFLDDCAYKSFMAKMGTGLYSVGWKEVMVNKVDAAGTVTEESHSVDDWSTHTMCLDELQHNVKANAIDTVDALTGRVADARKKLQRK